MEPSPPEPSQLDDAPSLRPLALLVGALAAVWLSALGLILTQIA